MTYDEMLHECREIRSLLRQALAAAAHLNGALLACRPAGAGDHVVASTAAAPISAVARDCARRVHESETKKEN